MSYYGVGNTTTRFVGMASGIDVDSIVKSLMDAEKLKIDAITQKKTVLEWQRDANKEVNTLVSDFMNKYLSASSPDTSISVNASYNSKSVIVGSNQCVKITAGSAAVNGAYTINSITSLATGANTTSASSVSEGLGNKISTATALKNLGLDFQFVEGVDLDDNPINSVSFKIGENEFSFKDTDTLQNVIDTVNKSNAGVTMSYSSLSDKISIKAKELGTGSGFNISDIGGNFFGAVKIAEGAIDNGSNAVLEINGYDVEQAKNIFTIDGITYNLLNSTDGEVSFNVTQNLDATYDKIKGFIDGYNALIVNLNAKIAEVKYRTFLPLTDRQRQAMNESDITAWEAKAKSGMLSNNAGIRKLLGDLRDVFSNTVQGAGISFANIGITTGKWAEKGALHIDETKLRNALANDPDSVSKLFLKTSTSTDTAIKYNESGLVQRFGNSIKSYTGLVNSTTLPFELSQIDTYSKKVADALLRMNEKEDLYYKKYAALETAMSKLSSQGSYFSSLLG